MKEFSNLGSVVGLVIFTASALITQSCTLRSTGVSAVPTVSAAQSSALPSLTVSAGQAGVQGMLTLSSQCTGSAQVFLLTNQGQTVYQSPAVNSAGDYEFTTVPGNYTIGAYASSGCGSQQPINLTSGQTTTVNLYLTPTTTLSGGTSNYPPTNYNPCPLGPYGYGCDPYYYPGSGGGMVGKPNIYLSGPAGTLVEVKLRYPAGSNVLQAVPSHGNGDSSSWRGILNSKGGISVRGVDYSYLFYDMRFTPEALQSSDAICVDRADLMPTLIAYLKNAGFHSNEISDFETYWSSKMISAPHYCVYPQEHAHIQGVSDLEIKPHPARLTRVWFFVIPDRGAATAKLIKSSPTSLLARFQKAGNNLTEIAFTERAKKRDANRSLASSGELEVREWGVGFLNESPAPVSK